MSSYGFNACDALDTVAQFPAMCSLLLCYCVQTVISFPPPVSFASFLLCSLPFAFLQFIEYLLWDLVLVIEQSGGS